MCPYHFGTGEGPGATAPIRHPLNLALGVNILRTTISFSVFAPKFMSLVRLSEYPVFGESRSCETAFCIINCKTFYPFSKQIPWCSTTVTVSYVAKNWLTTYLWRCRPKKKPSTPSIRWSTRKINVYANGVR